MTLIRLCPQHMLVGVLDSLCPNARHPPVSPPVPVHSGSCHLAGAPGPPSHSFLWELGHGLTRKAFPVLRVPSLSSFGLFRLRLQEALAQARTNLTLNQRLSLNCSQPGGDGWLGWDLGDGRGLYPKRPDTRGGFNLGLSLLDTVREQHRPSLSS